MRAKNLMIARKGRMAMKKRKIKNAAWYTMFVLPMMFVFLTVVVIPFFIGIAYSFFSWDGLPLNPKVWVGFDNYIRLFSDQRFLDSALRTVLFTVVTILLINVLGLTFAIVLTGKLKVRNVARTMLFMPYLIGGLILGYVWKFALGEGMAYIGSVTGWGGIFTNWLTDSELAMAAMIVVTTWQMAGYIMIIYITGIQAIPSDVIEAAQVDGAGFWQVLFKIKFPLLMPSFTICLFMTISNCLKSFDVNLSLTGGGPHNTTELFAMNIYNEIFSMNNYGYGQAKAIIFFIIVAMVTLTQVFLTKKREVEM